MKTITADQIYAFRTSLIDSLSTNEISNVTIDRKPGRIDLTINKSKWSVAVHTDGDNLVYTCTMFTDWRAEIHCELYNDLLTQMTKTAMASILKTENL